MADWVMVVLTGVYVVATIFICYFNFRSAKASKEQLIEMRRQYDAENKPYITVELIYEKRCFYGLRFTNHGKRIANNVSIQLNSVFVDSLIEPNVQSMLKKQHGRKCIIGIGQHYDLYIGTNKLRGNLPEAPLSGTITYSDGSSNYTEDFLIDLIAYSTFFSITSEFEDFMKEMKKHGAELSQIKNAIAKISSHMGDLQPANGPPSDENDECNIGPT